MFLCGAAAAETVYSPESGRMWSTDWDGGADLGRIVELAECSGTIEERVCTPLPQTLSYTLTIPESVNLSRAMTAEIFLSGLGWGFTGNCMGPDFEYNEIIWVNGVQVTDCPFNQPVSQFEWEIPIDPALLHTGVNTIEYDAAPWKQYEDVYGNTLYGGWTGVDDIRLTLQYTTAPPPKLTALHFSTDLFLTGHEFEVSPEVSGESPDWEIVGISYAITNQTTGNHDLYRVLPDTRNLTYTPAPGKYGKKLLEARMHARDTMTGKRVISEIITPITIYFEKGQYPHWVDDDSDGQPNWFEYWKADTAVPDIGNVTYDGAGDGYGVSNATGTYIFPLAATQHYTTPIVIASTGESFGGPGTTGVDCAAEVVAHELYHTDVRWKWQPGFEWYGLNDTDEEHVHAVTFENTSYYFDDDLPDSYEDTVSLTDSQFLTDTHGLADIKSEVYKFYGDQEYMAMRAGDSKRGVPENDWAYPGLQAGVRRTGAPMTVYPVPAGCSGACDIVSEPLPGDAGTGVSETPLDGNGNTLFDILTVGNDITVTQDGQHEIVAVLSGERGFGPEVIAIQRNVTELSAGSHAVTAVFRGTDISSAGIDGPYTMTLSWRHEYRENGPSPSATWQTAAYASTQFEPVSAGFAGTATGAPSGTDLAAAIPLTVNVPGTYTVEGYLEDPDGQVIAHATATAAYPAGAGEAVLVFDGDAIAAHHRDGIYRFTGFRILDAAGALVGRLADAGTVTITSDTFGTLQPFLSDSYADAGGQLTADGRYGVLSISAGMDAPAAGDYYYSATLFDANNNRVQTISDRLWVDAAGPVTIPFNFNGKIIASNRVNGTFTLRSFEVYGPGGGVDRRPCAYTTSAYAYTEFDQPAIVITGNVTDFPVDYDGNGLYDALRVGFDVEVGYTGCSTTGCAATFPISATLTGPGGSVISVTGSFPLLERYMTHHVTLDFDGTDINGAEIDGPYNVADLTAGFSYPSVYREPYLTAAYDHAQFEPAAILTGWVRDGDGFPVAGATIQAFENSGLTNVAGYYRLVYGESQSGGVSVVPPASSGLEGGSEIRSVEPGSTTFCNFTLYRYASLYGTVMAENGTLLTTGFVRAKGPSEKVFTLGTWNNGSYRLSSLKPGEYTVTYYPSAADLVANTTSGLLLPPGESREWNIVSYNPRALSGTVRDIAGTPVEGAEVSITDGPITSSYAIETDAAGSYAFSRLAPGMSTLYIEPPYGSGLVANTSTVSIALADTAVVHDIVLVPEPAVPEVMWPAIDPPEGRVPLTVAFTDRSTGYPTSWFWDFGDGTTSTDQHPLHTYTEAGTYTVSLTVINAYGSDSYAFTNCVHATDPRLVLPTGRLDPGSTGTSPLAAGDIEAAQEIRCALLYDPAVVRLDGVTAASARVETVGSAIDNTAGRADITITFAGGMQSVGDTALLADLQFTATGSEGDATTLTAVYADQVSCGGSEGCLPGDPEVLTNLTVIDGSIRIGAANPLPVPAFTAAPPAGNAPLAVTFDAAASGVLSPTGWLWAFGDGATSSVPNPSHTYTAPGMYDVSVTVTNGTGSWPFARQGCVAVSPEGAAATYVFVKSFGSEGSGSFGEAQFLYPEGIAVHPSGNLYITDPGNSRVQIVSPDGQYIGAFGSEGTGDGQFLYLRGIAADASGNVYVTDVRGHRVQVFSASGDYLGQWGGVGTAAGQLNLPSRIACDADGNLYVTELGNHRVQKFTPAGASLGMWGTFGSGDGQFTYPGGLAIDSSGNIYVAEGSTNHRVQKFDQAMNFVAAWGDAGSGDGQFQFPADIAAAADGTVFVADSSNNRVQAFSADGEYLTQWGSSGSGTGQFNYPYGVAVSSDGLVYVVDNENSRIQVFKRYSPAGLAANFAVNTTAGAVPLAVQFTDTSTGSPTGWDWDFGDRTSAADQNPVHVYTTSGTYTVSLNVTDGSTSDMVTRIDLIVVTPPPSSDEYGPDGTDPDYDGNGDAIPDWQQENVTSLHATTGDYVTLAVSPPAVFAGVTAIDNPSPADAPPATVFPVGFFSFAITGIAPGGSTTVELFLPADMVPDTYYKFGLTSDDPVPHWYPFPYDGTTGAEIAGSVVTLHLVDGGCGDSDLLADGEIADPGAPAQVTNRPPELDPVGNKNVNEGELLEFMVTATDPDMGDVLAYSALNLPASAIFTGQTFSWTPGYDAAGIYENIVFEVSDGNFADSETISITVADMNRAPELDPVGNKMGNEGELLEFTISATDPDTGDVLAYSASNLPAGAAFVDQKFSWTPGHDAAGTYENILFEVSDGGLADSETISITVAHVNRPPELDPVG
ncbi:MAG: PKD domain-containing protein, partial [Methanomicrobiales archaeon]|nr:PKD domain-containing protein [Methanomicrobiales archaeon]